MIERLNGSYRDGVLDIWVFVDSEHVREETGRWVDEYNTIRPHESLGDISPIEFLNDRGYAKVSIYDWAKLGEVDNSAAELPELIGAAERITDRGIAQGRVLP